MKIKSITQTTIIKENGTRYTNAYSEYDINGNEILAIDYEFDGSETSKTIAKFNDKNQKIEMQIFCGETEPNETHFYKYNDNNSIAQETIDYQGGFKSIKNYDYSSNYLILTTIDEDNNIEEKEDFLLDSDGNITEHIVTDYNGEITQHQTSQFENGKVIISKNLDKNNVEIDHRIYKYNSDGKIEFMGILNPKKELLDSYSYQYDEKGREILQTIGNRGQIVTEYNDEENIVTTITSTNTGRIVNQTINTYNADGKIVKEEDFTTIREYVYDFFA